MSGPAAISSRYSLNYILAALMIFASCTVVKKYPANRPFVFKTNIKLEGKFTTDEKKDLTSKLNQQLHDSIRVRTVQKLIGWEGIPRFFYSELRSPPVYDSLNADKSVQFMRALLNSLGYYRDTITYDTTLRIEGDQQRTIVNFYVTPGKLIRLDSISFNVGHDTLQKITLAAHRESLLKKGAPFAKALISSEFDRLTDVYRNNGYLLFSREELIAVWDTVGIALLRPTIDPIEQAQQLEELRRRRENPTADVEVRLRANPDTSHLIRFYVGNVLIYPDLTADTSFFTPTLKPVNDYEIITFRDLFNSKVLVENVFLKRGDLYNQSNYLKTLNRFNSLGAWRLVNIDQIPRANSDTVDFSIKLTPAKKYLFDANIEGSQNWGNVFPGNLVAINVGLQNRNFARGANQATTNFRFGTEVAPQSNFVQTTQYSFGQVILFPRVIPQFKFVPNEIRENFKTSFSFNTTYTNRFDFFRLTTINSSWGYDFNWKNKLLLLRFPNIEYAFLNVGPKLQELINSNQSYKYIFNSGFVASTIAGLTLTGGKENIANLVRFNLETSGIILGAFRSKFLDSNLHRFIKLDAEFKQSHKIRRSAVAWRVFGGVGYELPSSHNKYHFYLPFFKQYFAGGANSMRAWPLRKLGPGSTVKSFSRTVAPDRFGDIQLEANGEYRFYLTDMRGVKLNSVLFTDIGNIWYLRENKDFPNGEFQLSRLWKDLAIGAGTGLRIDFGLFLVRADYAYKVKNPSPDSENASEQNKWFYNWKPFNGQLQLGVTYPF
ncbi:MAG: BamA/TamA family outer membrane protein [Chitinophagaceae bacterium]|nr:BamA/TamA family outer membrane protein [Chitinophagaceae bacterium]